ncbi:hypothetical protein [Methanoregula formicica]|uniref:Uncharacterized protein n=1 Tax=Methanoregula formicica (strain DSM 22288 / NBRC 105244 / SMSP) TaxID=593750 RepID=L0HEW3_METFS|nr:hypothetical protein [Methanoregula formicica]AGB03257.1 hypothetical protein Metfor_2252 [Methanoregula formicica SMSP]
MDLSSARRIVTFVLVLLCAILVSNTLSNILLAALGLSGIFGFIVGFVIYAVFFFGVLYFFERFFGITIFRFGGR